MKTVAEFEEYISANPAIWALFVRYTLEAIRAGATRFSVDSITERVRWFSNIEVKSKDEFKINNDYRPHFSRKWAREFPEYADFFETRKAACDVVEVGE